MAENKKSSVKNQEPENGVIEKVKEVENKKLSDIENKKVVAEGEVVKKKSEPAVAKVSKKEKKVEAKIELEREYVVPMRKGFLNVPHYRRAKKAVKTLKKFMVRHMNIRDGDLRKVKVDIHLNNEIWFRGIKKPLAKIKVKAVKKDGIVYVTLVDVPDVVRFKMAREEKARLKAMEVEKKPKVVKKEVDKDKDKDGIDDVKEENEDKKAGTENAEKIAKGKTKDLKHTAQGKHAQKVAPVRKVLK
jgi:large subunit ribosomal protein L31e